MEALLGRIVAVDSRSYSTRQEFSNRLLGNSTYRHFGVALCVANLSAKTADVPGVIALQICERTRPVQES